MFLRVSKSNAIFHNANINTQRATRKRNLLNDTSIEEIEADLQHICQRLVEAAGPSNSEEEDDSHTCQHSKRQDSITSMLEKSVCFQALEGRWKTTYRSCSGGKEEMQKRCECPSQQVQSSSRAKTNSATR